MDTQNQSIETFKFTVFSGTEAYQTTYGESLDCSWDQFAEKICSQSWSPFTFSDNRRLKKNFLSTSLFVLDIDDGMTLAEAQECFSEFQHFIGTTQNHQKEKNGKPPCDRFRVVIPLEREITDEAEYEATFRWMEERFPAMDTACKDTSRFYFPCVDIISAKSGGSRISVVKPLPPNPPPVSASHVGREKDPPYPRKDLRSVSVSQSEKGVLSNVTCRFIAMGAPAGQWHPQLYKAVHDLKENHYSQEEAEAMLVKATESYKGYLDEHDIATIRDVYLNRGSKYGPRIPYGRQCSATPFLESIIPTENERLEELDEDRKRREQAFSNRVSLISHEFDQYLMLAIGLTMIGAQTGGGKSTVLANLVFHYLGSTKGKKKVLVLSNEETLEAVLSRVACLALNLNWNDYHNRTMDQESYDKVVDTTRKLNSKITVLTREMDSLEGVKSALETAKGMSDIGIVLLDYLQTVHKSVSDGKKKQFEVSKDLGQYFRDFGRNATIPVVLFTQLKPEGEEGVGKDFTSRVGFDKTICQHAVALLEVKANREQKTSRFHIHKDRYFGSTGKSLVLSYEKGRFVPFPPDHPIKKAMSLEHEVYKK